MVTGEVQGPVLQMMTTVEPRLFIRFAELLILLHMRMP